MRVGQKRKTVKNGGNPPFLCFFVRIMYSFALCGAFFGCLCMELVAATGF